MKNVKFPGKIIAVFIVIVMLSAFLWVKPVEAAKTYSQTLKSGIKSFPESYQVLLNKLVEETAHTEWTFQAYYTGIDWNEFISNQGKCKKNRIHQSMDSAYRASCNNLASEYYCATPDITAYFVDPRNFLNERNIFQFLEMSYNPEKQTREVLEGVIKKYKVFNYGKQITFKMAEKTHKNYNKTVTMTFTDILMEVAETTKMSPLSLAIKIVQEVGGSGSGSTSGNNEKYPNCYNYFNVGASDTGDAIINGLKYADSKGWNCPYSSILGGAKFNSDEYITQGQNTLYFYKFDCVGTKILKNNETVKVSSNNTCNHQYMTNIYDPYNQSIQYFDTYTNYDLLNEPLNFIIPVFDNMPTFVEKPSTLSKTTNQDLYYADITSSCYTRTSPKTSAGNVKVEYVTSKGKKINYDLYLYKDDLVIMLDRKFTTANGYTWDKVQFWNGKVGYVVSDLLSKYDKKQTATGGNEEEEQTKTDVIGYGYANVKTTLNIRSGAGTSYSTVGSLKAKEQFYILKKIDNWYQIKTEKDVIGYVTNQYAVNMKFADVNKNTITIIPNTTADVLANYLEASSYTVKKSDTKITNNVLGTNYTITAGDKTYTIIKAGDVNGDGKVNTGDALTIQKHATKIKVLKDNYVKAVDVNKDGKYNTGDALAVQKYVTKIQPIILEK